MKKRKHTILLTAVVGIIWTAAIAGGFFALWNYETSPGQVGKVGNFWPPNSSIALANDRPTLVMMAHPRCPCTRATMDELAQIAAHIRRAAQIYVLFYTPSAATRDWENSDLRDAAARIPGVTVLSDIDGVEAERFGAETSGHTFLFATDGRLLFSGGITASRGHVGDNAGESAIVSLINNQTPTRPNTFVFGCAFHDRTQQTKRPPCLR